MSQVCQSLTVFEQQTANFLWMGGLAECWSFDGSPAYLQCTSFPCSCAGQWRGRYLVRGSYFGSALQLFRIFKLLIRLTRPFVHKPSEIQCNGHVWSTVWSRSWLVQTGAMRSEELQENRIKRGVDRAIKACASRTFLGDGRFKSLHRHASHTCRNCRWLNDIKCINMICVFSVFHS